MLIVYFNRLILLYFRVKSFRIGWKKEKIWKIAKILKKSIKNISLPSFMKLMDLLINWSLNFFYRLVIFNLLVMSRACLIFNLFIFMNIELRINYLSRLQKVLLWLEILKGGLIELLETWSFDKIQCLCPLSLTQLHCSLL